MSRLRIRVHLNGRAGGDAPRERVAHGGRRDAVQSGQKDQQGNVGLPGLQSAAHGIERRGDTERCGMSLLD
jgi:hypothetical protein